MSRFVGLGEDPGVLAIRAPDLFGVRISEFGLDLLAEIVLKDDRGYISRRCQGCPEIECLK
jgi:hypothetical protein